MKLFCFGLGYSAMVLARRLQAKGWQIAGTARSPAKCDELMSAGIAACLFDASAPGAHIAEHVAQATHVLASVPPGEHGDPVLGLHGKDIATARPHWIGYLSTVGVYGDKRGAWCDEDTPRVPATDRGGRRVAAEDAWSLLARQTGSPTGVFRLAGIYGPGRNQLESLRAGTAKRIVKQGQVFNRIHVDDIATTLEASIARPPDGARAYNVCDDEPAPPQDVVAFAAQLLGMSPPPETAFGEAELSPMAKSFYADNKRCSNRRIKHELSVRLAYPTYREGLRALAGSLD